ncbi:hypothetical protein DPEC_G00187140 [Dallia pectoralis]|uniref:Uncharacterized protein n=1 Tax=Dallia pectoralis TaxID=75939 RepID=A0ACC2GBZ1_DALPE|nr:hypothetical protein DPEC_G00187140 [Dallia pectoralis]
MHSGLTLLAVSFFTVPISTQPVPETFNLTVPDGPISSHSGSSVDLLCQVSPVFNIQPFEVRWSWSDDSNEPALLYKDQKIQEDLMDQRFRGRVSLTAGLERGNASLRLERVTLEDSGEFGCYIASKTWYDKASVVLTVSDSQGLVSVSSSLLYSPSESEWLSCIVSLSDEWKTEGRILPTLLSGDSIEGFTVNQVLLVVLRATASDTMASNSPMPESESFRAVKESHRCLYVTTLPSLGLHRSSRRVSSRIAPAVFYTFSTAYGDWEEWPTNILESEAAKRATLLAATPAKVPRTYVF